MKKRVTFKFLPFAKLVTTLLTFGQGGVCVGSGE